MNILCSLFSSDLVDVFSRYYDGFGASWMTCRLQYFSARILIYWNTFLLEDLSVEILVYQNTCLLGYLSTRILCLL